MSESHDKALDDLTENSKKRKLLKPLLIAAAAGISFFLAVFFIVSPSAFSQFFGDASPLKPSNPTPGESVTVPQGPQTKRYDFKLTGADTFYNVMSLLSVPGPEIHTMAEKARPVYDLRQLRKDSVIRVFTKDNKWERVEYKFSDYETLVVEAEGGIKAYKTELPHEKKAVVISGRIENSLYEDGIKAGADPQLIVALSDIFAWDVDFASDIRKGDSFSIVTEMLFVNDKPVRAGRIIGAEMVNDGRKYTAIYFQGTDGRGSYFDADGKSLTRTLLKSPLRFRRITSYFTNRRFHPILKEYRPHHGIDYAAPTGTPVESAGNGRVVFSGWKNGYGNFIQVRHNNNYITGYGHLSRVARGIRRGAKIDQGEVIGFVGSTGISTGPHLHYEVRINNKLVNPLSIKATPDRSITASEKNKFAVVKNDVMSQLESATVAGSAGNVHVSKANPFYAPKN